jgi:hypothetical protein
MVLAEVDRAIAVMRRPLRVRCKRPRVPRIDQVLQQIGLYDRLGMTVDIVPDDETVMYWHPATGVLSDGETGGSLLEQYQGRLADGISKGLYDGIVEAMTNTLHHAYIGEIGRTLKRGLGNRWWMLSQERDGFLTVAICDLGIGIPRSLFRSGTFSRSAISSLWQTLKLDRSDASAIKVALQLGKTRTGQPGRGKGLSEIVDAVRLSEDGGVLILSNKGLFTSAKGKDYSSNASLSIRGTLIQWMVPTVTEDLMQ